MSRRRGASTVELALGLLLIVPCVLYGVHAGELFIVGAKAQEAEIQAAWDVTAYRYHDYETANGAAVPSNVQARYDAVATAVSTNIDAELADLNSYATSGRRGVTLVAGRAEFQGRAVTCERRDLRPGGYLERDHVLPFSSFDFGTNPWWPTRAPEQEQAFRGTLTREHLITCRSRLRHTTLWVPTTWMQDFSNERLNPLVAPMVFGGLGSSLNGTRSGSQPSLGMAMLTDDWAVEDENRVSRDEVAMKVGFSSNPKFYRAAERVHEALSVYFGDEQLNEDMTMLLGHRFMHGEERDNGEIDAFRLALDTAYTRLTNLQLESPLDPNDGNLPWHLLPHRDGEKSHPSLDVVFSTRQSRSYLGHPNASFNRP
ncbi:MAG: hypothetical protein JNK82_13475 [Myxococcaceae bacterium]|nr:hypothetical protein [Myxococcaceae bacterium]